MNDFYNINLQAIEHKFDHIDIQAYKEVLTTLNEKLTPYLFTENESLWLVGKTHFYHIFPCRTKVELWSKSSVINTEFIQAAPYGKAIVLLNDNEMVKIEDVKKGRIADFLQSIFPKSINQAHYDNTVRGQNARLFNLDHAEQIDKLRRYMQEGKISQYEFDDYNPAYPKAGK